MPFQCFAKERFVCFTLVGVERNLLDKTEPTFYTCQSESVDPQFGVTFSLILRCVAIGAKFLLASSRIDGSSVGGLGPLCRIEELEAPGVGFAQIPCTALLSRATTSLVSNATFHCIACWLGPYFFSFAYDMLWLFIMIFKGVRLNSYNFLQISNGFLI